MEIYPFDKTVEDVFSDQDITNIQADGISIRSGNKIIRLQVTEEVVIDDTDTIRKELEDKFKERFSFLTSEFDNYKEQMQYSLREEKNKLEHKQNELDRRMNEVSVLPALTRQHLHTGLSVAINDRGGLVWSYKTVYAPKFVGKRRIDPTFAKRLVTPIAVEVWTNQKNQITKLIVRQILGNKKFHHYHSMSQSSDCWGSFRFDGKNITTPDEMVTFCQEVSLLLETINDMSIGTNNPRGLSRLATVEKHLLKAEDDAEDSQPKTNTNSRNSRAGVDLEAQEAQNAEAVWST
jgi:hypothetical protein